MRLGLQTVSRPHLSILIGGMGEKKTLRLVAKYGDACNFIASIGIDGLRAKLDVLKRHCEAVGRPFEEIERTALGWVDLGPQGMTPKQVVDYCCTLQEAGIQHLILTCLRYTKSSPWKSSGER